MATRSPAPFGVLLKRYRLAALLTQGELAERAQLSPDTIRALERGKRRAPRPESVRLLTNALQLTGAERAALIATVTPLDRATTNERVERMGGARLLVPFIVQPNAFIGRERELELIRRRLTGDAGVGGARLLTLTGPAGVGKTRLALTATGQIGDHFPDGVAFVDLTPVRDPSLALPAIGRALGLADAGGSALYDSFEERLRAFLAGRRMLLALDNFEQALPAAGALAGLLESSRALTVLVTSRIPLRLRWELVVRLAPLRTPDLSAPLPPLETLAQIPAVALFVARAQAQQPSFVLTDALAPVVARLVSELDGLPLALELAAARLDVIALPLLARRLGDRLRLLRWEAPDAPSRQHSLEAAVGWSYALLDAPEQRLLRCLGVFVGQVSLAAICAVARAVVPVEAGALDEGSVLDGLASLAEKSLTLPDRPAHDDDLDPAFRMLETVREYAWEQLTRRGELEAARRAHARYFRALAEQAAAHLRGPDQRAWFFRLEREHDNLRAALRWWLEQERLPDADVGGNEERDGGLAMASALSYFWWTRGYLEEGWRWLEEALRRAPQADAGLRVRALIGAGPLLIYQGDFERARGVLEEASALAGARRMTAEAVSALAYLGLRAIYAGDVAGSVPLLREALDQVRALDDPQLAGLVMMYLGTSLLAQGQDAEAEALFAESLASFETAGDGRFAGNLEIHLGWFAARRSALPEAVRRIGRGLHAGVVFEERRLLSVGAQVALSLAGATGETAALATRARLLGGIDALSQATGMTLLQTRLQPNLAQLRERLLREGFEAEYRAGRSLPFDEIAGLAFALLNAAERVTPRAPVSSDLRSRSWRGR